MSEKHCVLCGDLLEHGYGANAWPLAKGDCCVTCDKEKVFPARKEKSRAEDEAGGFIGPIQIEWGEYRGMTIRHDKPIKREEIEHRLGITLTEDELKGIHRQLINEAKQQADDQAARAREFQAQYERTIGRKLSQREPITREWLRARQLPWLYSTCIPGRLRPELIYGPNYKTHPDYVPIEQRLVMVPKAKH